MLRSCSDPVALLRLAANAAIDPVQIERHQGYIGISCSVKTPTQHGTADFRAIPHSTTEAQEDFEAAAEEAKTLSPEPTDEDKLVLYGLFKQATVGDVNTGKPGIFDQKGRAKWTAWDKVKGKSKDEAQTEYIAKVKELKG